MLFKTASLKYKTTLLSTLSRSFPQFILSLWLQKVQLMIGVRLCRARLNISRQIPIIWIWILVIASKTLQSTAKGRTNDQRGFPLPVTEKLYRGQGFIYICCATKNSTIIFRWGLYMHLSPREPNPLYSRVEVKGVKILDNLWTREYKESKYYNRVKIAYDANTLCMSWILSRVRQGDDNVFYAVYRDDKAFGKQFEPCNVTKRLVVMPSPQPRSPPSSPTPKYLDLDIPPTEESIHVSETSTEFTEGPTVDSESSDDEPEPKPTLQYVIGIAAVLVIAIACGVLLCIKWPRISEWYDRRKGASDRTINPQEEQRKIKKKRRRQVSALKKEFQKLRQWRR